MCRIYRRKVGILWQTNKENKDTGWNNEVRAVGIALISTDDLTAPVGGTVFFIGQTEVDGETRFFEIKVTAKKERFYTGRP